MSLYLLCISDIMTSSHSRIPEQFTTTAYPEHDKVNGQYFLETHISAHDLEVVRFAVNSKLVFLLFISSAFFWVLLFLPFF